MSTLIDEQIKEKEQQINELRYQLEKLREQKGKARFFVLILPDSRNNMYKLPLVLAFTLKYHLNEHIKFHETDYEVEEPSRPHDEYEIPLFPSIEDARNYIREYAAGFWMGYIFSIDGAGEIEIVEKRVGENA